MPPRIRDPRYNNKKRKREKRSNNISDFDNPDSEPDTPKDDDSEDEGDFNSLMSTNLPDSPHPDVKKLKPLDFRTLPDGFFVIAYGARRTGKTHMLSCELEKIKDRFDFAYLFSATAGLHKGEKGISDFDFIRDEAKFRGFKEEYLHKIIERSKIVKELNNHCERKRDKKPNQVLIIFDDFVHEKAVRYSKIFTELPVLGRHYEISVICLSQGYSAVGSSGLNPATRQNSDMVITFKPRNLEDQERIATWYLGKTKMESTWFVRSATEKEHTCLAIDLQHPHLTEFPDFCYTCKSQKDIPKYEVGKVQWKLFHEERKRNRAATLQASLETERAFLSDIGGKRKMHSLGEATGMLPKQGRLSLHDYIHNH